MGRKSTNKTRKPLSKKMEIWLSEFIPTITDKDLSQLTIDEIATLTNKSKSTLYEYFESKEAIIYMAVQQRIDALGKLPQPDKHTSIIVTYNRLIEWLITHLNDISFSFLNQLELHFSEAWLLINDFMKILLSLLQTLYVKGIAEGVFRKVSIELLIDMDEFFITKWLSRVKKDQTIDQMIVDYVDIRLNGIMLD